MSDMLNALLKVWIVENVYLVDESGKSILTRLQTLARRIERDLKDCGHLVHLFHATSLTG